MSRDSLPRYELLTQVSEGSVRTYHALARTGAVVMVHFVDVQAPDGSPTAERALQLVERLDPAERRKILETAQVEGAIAIVSKFVLDFDSFFDWLERGVAGVAEPTASQTDSGSSAPGEFTALFRSPVADEVPPPSAAGLVPDGAGDRTSDAGADSVPSTSKEASEPLSRAVPADDSRSFSEASPPSESAASRSEGIDDPAGDMSRRPPPTGSDLPLAEESVPGEFTRAFRAFGGEADATFVDGAEATEPGPAGAVHPPGPPVSMPSPAPADDAPPERRESIAPGEFTRAFRAPDTGDSIVDPAPVIQPRGDEDRKTSPGAVNHPGPPTDVNPPSESAPGEFTRAFRAFDPDGFEASEASSSEAAPTGPTSPAAGAEHDPSAGSTPPSSGPGEFTRMFRLPDAQQGGDGASTDVDSAPSEASPSPDPNADPPRVGGTGEPGEFTRMFQSPVPDPKPGPGLEAPREIDRVAERPSDLPDPNLGGPGPAAVPPELPAPVLRWRGDDSPDAKAVPSPGGMQSPKSDQPGEFTRIFGRQELPGAAGSPPTPSDRISGPDYRPPQGPGGLSRSAGGTDDYFNKLVGKTASRHSPPVPPATPPPPGPRPGEQPGAPNVPPWLGGVGNEERNTAPPPGPSEYTRVISAQRPPPPPAAVAPPKAPAQEPVSESGSRSSPTALLIGILAVLVIMLVVIFVFALRSPDDSTPAESEAVTESVQESPQAQ